MLPNEKLSLLALKNLLDENGANRITPKLLRDFLVSAYGSRYGSRIVDSHELGENDDIVVARMTEDENYLRLPDSKANDTSGTPYDNKRFTIYNESPEFGFRIITQANDQFMNEEGQVLQEVPVKPNEVWEVFCFGERWFAYLAGTVPEDISGSPSIVTRFQQSVSANTTRVIDTVHEDVTTLKWIIRCENDTEELYSSLEILCTKRKNSVDHVEYANLGDTLDVLYEVKINVNGEIELEVTNNLNGVITLKVLKQLVD